MQSLHKVIALSLLTSLLSACGKPPEQAMLEDTGREVILPLHERFLSESLSLSQQAQQFCSLATRDDTDLAAIRAKWLAAMNAWEGIQNIQFGPVTEDNQAWKVQFWPDRKNLIARKTEQFVRRDDAISLPALQKASVVIQGLSAIEYLLYDKPAKALVSGVPGHYCEHLGAAALNLHQVAERLYQGWHPKGENYLGHWAQPGEHNLDFPDANASVSAIIETLVYGVERIKRDKLQRPLGLEEGGQPNPYLLEWWRSQQSREAILINLHSLQMLYSAGESVGLADLLAKRGADELANKITADFDLAISAIASLETSLFQNHADPAAQEALRELYEVLGRLLSALKREVPSALEITLGFNSNDGD